MPEESQPLLDCSPIQTSRAPALRRPTALVVLISTVAPEAAISQVAAALPADCTAGLLALPDVRKGFSSLLCERLRAEIPLPVREIAGESFLRPGELCIVPSQSTVEFSEDTLGGLVRIREVESPADPETGPRRSVEALKSACAVFKSKVVGIMLSGMAADGCLALQTVKDAGGLVIAQDQATSMLFDGPRQVIEKSLADHILPLWAIGAQLGELLEEV